MLFYHSMSARFILSRLILATSVSALSALLAPAASAGTFSWTGTTNFWTTSSAWSPASAPTGNDPTDILNFAGDVSLPYTSTNNIAVNPFRLNRINLSATGLPGNFHSISGTPLAFSGNAPELVQNGAGAVAFNTPFQFEGTFTASGFGAGLVTANAQISGIGKIVKNGTSTFRFGTPFVAPTVGPSANTFLGAIEINAGTVRFNNNAESGRTAVRGNPVILNGVSSVFSCSSEIRSGVISGPFGDVRTTISTADSANPPSESIVITALSDGTYGGSLTLSPPIGTGNDRGQFIVRGTGTQTLTGTLSIDKDVILGRGATLVLSGNASLGSQVKGAIVLSGGTVVLDNEDTNNNNRLRNGGTTTTLEPIGGGALVLSGNGAGTQEVTGRFQLGSFAFNPTTGLSETKARSGNVNLQIIDRAAGGAITSLTFENYSRDQQQLAQFTTINFSAINDDTTPQYLLLGQGGNGPRFFLTSGAFSVPLSNDLLNVTAGSATFGVNSVGWATVTGPATGTASTNATVDFATHGATGIAPVTTVPWSGTLTAADNARVTGSAATPGGASIYTVNSIKLSPSGPGQSLNIAGTGDLNTTAILLAGGTDYTIRSTGGGGISGAAPRFFHVDRATLNVDAGLAGANHPVVKSGNGVLALNNVGNFNLNQILAINAGTVRATPGTTLTGGEIRLRGGVLEIQGGGTFARTIGIGADRVNWTGLTNLGAAQDEDRGGGGFSAFGADVSVTLNGGAQIYWEDLGFVRSGHGLIFGSSTANAVTEFTNPLSLTAFDNAEPNYNAREIRVLDNPGSATDWARVSGIISGTIHNDLLKSGPGTLELSATNTYLGTTQVNEGRLLVTGSIDSGNGVIVRGTGSISGTGTVGTIILDGGAVEPGSNGVGTLNAASVYWRTGAIKVDVGAGGDTSDTLALGAGRLHKDPLGGAPYEFDFAGGGEGGRTYTLATFGSTTFVAGDFSAANLRPGLTPTFAINAGVLTMATNLPTPVIGTQPQSVRVNVGGSASFTVATQIPGAYSYQWYKNDEIIDGQTSPTLSFPSVTPADGANYKVVITNGTTPVTSNVVALTANEAPVATAQSVGTNEDTGKAITLAGTDPNPGDTLTFQILTQPTRGALSGTLPNITYTPGPNFNGTDSFTFRVRDGLLDSPAATVSIDIAPVNDAPVAVSDSVVTGVETNIVANDTDIDSTTLAIQSVANGSFGTVAINSPTTVTYTPGAGFSLSDTFTYVVTDGSGGTATGTVTVRLGAPVSFGISAKSAAVSGEPVGTVFSTSLTPSVSADGRVAFAGSYLTPARKTQNALFFGNPPVPVVRTGITNAPNTTLTFAKVGNPIVNAAGDIGFKGSLTKAPAGTADGIWVISNGVTRLVAQGKMAVPGITGATFSKFGDIAFPDDGRLIFAATIKGVLATADTGIWRETGTSSVAPVVREGDVINAGGLNRSVKTLALFGPAGKTTLGQRRGFNNNGAVLARVGFTDKSSAMIRFNSNGSRDVIAVTGVPRPELANSAIKSFGLPVIADDDSISFPALLQAGTGNASASSDSVLLRRSAAGVLSIVAQESSPAVNIPGSAFKSLSETVSGEGNRTGFIGTLKAKAGGVTAADDTGIWRHNAAGTMAQLAREGGPAPGTTNAVFSAFTSLAWTGSGNAGAAFVAKLKGTVKGSITPTNDAGFWVEDSTGALVLALRKGQTVTFGTGPKTLKSFTVLGPALGALGQGGSTNYIGGFAVLATFTDKSTGVLTVWVP